MSMNGIDITATKRRYYLAIKGISPNILSDQHKIETTNAGRLNFEIKESLFSPDEILFD